MKRMLIVDDEKHIVDYLFELFELESGMDLEIHKAYSATEAVELLNRNKMDLVLSDIRMPGMSGLQLMEYISQRWPMCRVVFLTGYKSFDYIYETGKYPNTMYLMKTEDDDVIRATVRRQLDMLDRELGSQRMLEQTLAKSTLLEQSAFLHDLEMDRHRDMLEQSAFSRLHIPLRTDRPFLIAVSLLNENAEAPVADTALSIHAILHKQMSSLLECVVWIGSEDLICWILQSMGEEPDPLNVRDQLEDVQDSCHELLGLDVSIVLSKSYVKWPQFSSTCRRLGNMARYSLPRGERLIHMEEVAEVSEPQETDQISIDGQALEALELALRESGVTKEALLDRLERVIAPLNGIRSMHHLGAIELYQSVALLFLRYINRMNLRETIAFHTGLNMLFSTDTFGSWQEAVQYLTQIASLLFDLRRKQEGDYRSQMCARIKKYVEENLAGDLSLSTIADYMRYNPSYISRIFKQLEGVNLSDYILNQRIDYAKSLLKGEMDTISEIALAVGFDSPQYFATVFKKHVGVSPHKYRVHQE